MRQTRRYNAFKLLVLATVIGSGLAAFVGCNGNGGTDTQSYALAYSALSDKTIKVRWSIDGVTWNDGIVPPQSWADGMGMAATPNKLLNQIAGWDGATKKVRILQGLSPDRWADRTIAAVPPEVAKSVPALAFLGSGKWLVVYRTTGASPDVGDNIAARRLDTGVTPPQYIEGNVFGFPGQDTRTEGRPVVAAVNGKVVLAWRTQTGQPGVHVGFGTLNQGQITWGNHVFLPLNEPAFCSTMNSEPVLTHDQSAFYLGFLCSEQGSLKNKLYVLKSSDGNAWGYYGNWDNLPGGIPTGAKIGLAGRADGSLIALALTADQQILAAKCAGGDACKEQGNVTWQTLDGSRFFNVPPSQAQFAFIASGQAAR